MRVYGRFIILCIPECLKLLFLDCISLLNPPFGLGETLSDLVKQLLSCRLEREGCILGITEYCVRLYFLVISRQNELEYPVLQWILVPDCRGALSTIAC